MIQELVDFLSIHKDKFEQSDLDDFVQMIHEITEQEKVDCLAAFFIGLRMGQTVKDDDSDAIVECCGKILDGDLTYSDSQGDTLCNVPKKYDDKKEIAKFIVESYRDVEKMIAGLIYISHKREQT